MMMSFAALGVVGIVWALAGYSLAFGEGTAWAGDFAARQNRPAPAR
jgi:Amt family ammonium transporter